MAIRHGLKLQELNELVKQAYIAEAQKLLVKTNQAKSISRISVITGVHRKDVSRYLGDIPTDKKKPNVLARIIADWQHNPDFSQNSNKARSLTITGKNSEFARLVKSVAGGDLDSYTALFELKRIGAVKCDQTDQLVELLWKEYAPPVSEHEALNMLVEDTSDLQSAILYNIDRDKKASPNLHLKTEYTRIPHAELAKVRRWLLEKGSAFHKQIRSYLSKYDLDTNQTDQHNDLELEYRVSVGTFSFIEEQTTRVKE